jgi:hypothetical protein
MTVIPANSASRSDRARRRSARPAESSAALQRVENFAQDGCIESATNGDSRSLYLDHDARIGFDDWLQSNPSNDPRHSYDGCDTGGLSLRLLQSLGQSRSVGLRIQTMIAQAARWDIVAQLTKELEARRL